MKDFTDFPKLQIHGTSCFGPKQHWSTQCIYISSWEINPYQYVIYFSSFNFKTIPSFFSFWVVKDKLISNFGLWKSTISCSVYPLLICFYSWHMFLRKSFYVLIEYTNKCFCSELIYGYKIKIMEDFTDSSKLEIHGTSCFGPWQHRSTQCIYISSWEINPYQYIIDFASLKFKTIPFFSLVWLLKGKSISNFGLWKRKIPCLLYPLLICFYSWHMFLRERFYVLIEYTNKYFRSELIDRRKIEIMEDFTDSPKLQILGTSCFGPQQHWSTQYIYIYIYTYISIWEINPYQYIIDFSSFNFKTISSFSSVWVLKGKSISNFDLWKNTIPCILYLLLICFYSWRMVLKEVLCIDWIY